MYTDVWWLWVLARLKSSTEELTVTASKTIELSPTSNKVVRFSTEHSWVRRDWKVYLDERFKIFIKDWSTLNLTLYIQIVITECAHVYNIIKNTESWNLMYIWICTYSSKVYDWFELFHKGIQQYQHFRFSSDKRSDSKENKMLLLKSNAPASFPLELPQQMHPKGLTEERRRYLYRFVRHFVRPAA
jgi:hypothetical protein